MGVKHRLFHRYQRKQGGQLLMLFVKAQLHKKSPGDFGHYFVWGNVSTLDKQAEIRLLAVFLGC